VEVIVEGEKRAVDDFVAWCKRGPPSAEVEDVHVKLRAPRDEFRTFTVAR
jgi:acylphosphatase